MAKQISLKVEEHENNTIFLGPKPPEASRVQRLTIDMPSDLHREFKIWCVMNNLKMNELIRDLIRETIKS